MKDATRHRRFERARAMLAHGDADWLLVPPSADFRWLTGAVARSTERLVALALPRAGEPFCIVPKLEAGSLAHECPWLDLEVWTDGEDPFDRLAQRLKLNAQPVVMLGEGLRVTPLLRLASEARLKPAAESLGALRVVKDAEEIDALERAARHADQVVESLADELRPGMTEREVARMALSRFEGLGDTEPWAICASGPNAALPHHQNSDRRIEARDVVILDVGAFTDGYGSDITRTYWMGDPPENGERVYETVDRARAAGVAAAKSGAVPEEVDAVARDIITAAGYGEFFIHRLGHGLGLEVHEAPFITAGRREPLAAGMVHSVEPGIYLPGRYGVRIEDIVVVADQGGRLLNQAPRDPLPPRLRTRTAA